MLIGHPHSQCGLGGHIDHHNLIGPGDPGHSPTHPPQKELTNSLKRGGEQ
jgi:hypothetical protein